MTAAYRNVSAPTDRTRPHGFTFARGREGEPNLAHWYDQLPKKLPGVICKQLPEGAVLYSTSEEIYFGLNRVGAVVWELLPPACTSFDELCQELAGRYTDVTPDVIAADLAEMLGALRDNGLVIPVTDASEGIAPG